MAFPDIHIINRFIGTCLIGANAISQERYNPKNMQFENMAIFATRKRQKFSSKNFSNIQKLYQVGCNTFIDGFSRVLRQISPTMLSGQFFHLCAGIWRVSTVISRKNVRFIETILRFPELALVSGTHENCGAGPVLYLGTMT